MSRIHRQHLISIGLLLNLTVSAFAWQSKPGQAVMVRWQGINYAAHLVSSEGGKYQIRYAEHREGRPDEEWVGVDRLKNKDYSPFRPDGGTTITPTPGANAKTGAGDRGGTLPVGRYACYIFISGTGLVNNGEFTLFENGNYQRGESKGKFTYVAGTGRLTFQGGVMDGRAAQYESRKAPTLHMIGNAGRVLAAGEERFVASCELQP